MMYQWFEQFHKIYELWMRGRYGKDELNQFLLLTSLVPIVISIFLPKVLYFAIIPLGFAMYRSCSKDIATRRKERNLYIRIFEDIVQCLKVQQCKWRDRKTHRYFTCKNCKAVFRVPKGKGQIEVICPKCGEKQVRKS